MNADASPPERDHPDRRTLGFSVMAGSSIVFAGMSLLVRFAKDVPGLTTYHATLFRFVIGILVVLGGSWVTRRPLRVVNWPWFVARGLFGGVAVLVYFYAIAEVGLAKGTILNHTFPLWAGLFAPIVIKERVPPGLWIAVAAAFGGVYLLIVPSEGLGGVTWADLIALSGGVTAGFAVLTIKRLRDTDSSFAIYFSQSIFGLAMVAYPATRAPFRFEPIGWVLLIGIGLVASVGQLMMTYAFKHVGGTEGALLAFLVPVANAIMGVAIFHEVLSLRMLVGGSVVLAACLYATVLPPPEGIAKRDETLRL